MFELIYNRFGKTYVSEVVETREEAEVRREELDATFRGMRIYGIREG